MRTRSISFLLLVGGLLLAGEGCNYLRLSAPLRHSPTDWTMYGGSMLRANVAPTSVRPPLKPAWEYDASAGFSPYSAAVVDSLIFVGNLQGEVHAVHLLTGRRVGSYRFGAAIAGTPVVDNEMIFIPLANTDEGMLSYDLRNGRVRWRARTGEVETSPLLIGRRLYVTTTNGKLVCLDKHTGETEWVFAVPAASRTKTIRSSPASDGSTIVFGADNGTVYAVSADDGRLRWNTSTGGAIVASPSIERGRVFVGSLDESFYAFDLDSGRILWTQPLGGKIFASQAVDGHRVYVGTVGRSVYALDAATGAVGWKVNTDEVISSAPILSGDVLYVGSIGKRLYAFDARSGTILWQHEIRGRIKTMPIVARDRLVVLAEDRSVIAFQQVSEP